MEGFESGELLADTGKLERLASDVAHRQRRAATRVTVELGQHDAGERQRLVEGACGVDRILAEHRVDHEQGLDRLYRSMQGLDLGHHGLVHREPAGGVDQQHVDVVLARVVERGERDVDRLLRGLGGEEPDPGLCRHRLQLLDRRRAIDVGGHHQHLLLLLLVQELGELAGGGGLARTLQAGHQHHRGRLSGQIQPSWRRPSAP